MPRALKPLKMPSLRKANKVKRPTGPITVEIVSGDIVKQEGIDAIVNAGVRLGLARPEDDVTVLYGLVLKF